jgi:Helix-hairpin-helix motif
MKNLKFLIASIFITFYSIQPLLAQSDNLLNLINDLSEDETYLNDLLLDLQESPININRATRDDLITIPLITYTMADSIIALRQLKGRFRSKRALRPIITPAIYDLIKSFITVSEKEKYKLKITQRSSYKLEPVPEIESGRYQGNALNNYSRLKYQYSPFLSFGFIAQKDPGELNYVDHANFSAQFKRREWNIIAGDFYVQFGQGLSQSNPYGTQKSIYLSAVFREPSQIARPNLTSSEATGKFGVFVENNFFKQLGIFAFYSKANRDIRTEDGVITGFNYTGFHRSVSEINSKNKIIENNWGTGFYYRPINSLKIGGLINQYHFNKPIENNFTVLGDKKRRQYFAFEGDKLEQAALSYNWTVNYFKFSGEYSQAKEGGPGWMQSAYFFKDKFKLGATFWRMAKDFLSVDGRSFDDSDAFPQGTSGYFAGIQFSLIPSLSFGGFKMYEQNLWRSYFDPMPTDKNEWLGQLNWKTQTIFTTLRYRNRESESFKKNGNEISRVTQNQKYIRLEIKYKPAKNVILRTRWEQTNLAGLDEKGTLFFQDFEYRFLEKITLNTRFTFFNTTSFDSRIYEYERGLPGTFSNLALFGNGHKSYLLIKWHLLNNFTVWLKGRYITKDTILKTGETKKELNRDLRMQFALLF